MNQAVYSIWIAIICCITSIQHASQADNPGLTDSTKVSSEVPTASELSSDEVVIKCDTVYASSLSDQSKALPQAIHPAIGEEVMFGKGKSIRLIDKLQNFSYGSTLQRDPDIYSPKSVNIHPSGSKFYINSLEGGKTVVYSLPRLDKLTVITHRFDEAHSHLWTPQSGLFQFRHYTDNIDHFMGKPVESAFSHEGRYLWVPYYRRSFDLNAQDPSALAVIDTSTDTIVRLMEAGVLPKMIAVSPDGAKIALTHWGDNTVGIIDISSDKPTEWRYRANVAVEHQLKHDLSLTVPVDRDKNTGEALRGTVFTTDSRYILIGCMSGGGIAVVDALHNKYLGKLTGVMPNIRHLVIYGDWLYASINASGYVQRIRLDTIMKGIERLGDTKRIDVPGWQSVKVAAGARTLELSPRGDYIFVACNSGSRICIVDSSMNKVGEIDADSYPVGLDVSPDGQWLITTSQGRKNVGGNCVDIFRLSGIAPLEKEEAKVCNTLVENPSSSYPPSDSKSSDKQTKSVENHTHLFYIAIVIASLLATLIFLSRS